MTTTVDTYINCSSQEQAQADLNTSPNGPSPAPPTVLEDTGAGGPPPASDIDDVVAKRRQKDELRALGKTFGNIPNIPVLAEWKKRVDCSNSAVHRSVMAGICGNGIDGAYSIALSGLYQDDEDGGDVIIYTGAGGRKRWTDTDPPRRLRAGPHTLDQSWDNPPNKALIISSLTRNPVRVIRSWRCPSQYAPVKGYRYDGLYKVAAVWTAKGRNGKKICRCRLERLPDQPPIPLRPTTLSTSRKGRRERLVSQLPCNPSPSTNPCDTLDNTDSDKIPGQSNSKMHSSESTDGQSEELPDPTQRAIPETFADIDVHITDEVDVDAKGIQPQHSNPQRGFSPNLSALPRYRWDPKKHELVRFPGSDPIPANFGSADGNEEWYRGEDDATLIPSDDGYVDMMPADECMETGYSSD